MGDDDEDGLINLEELACGLPACGPNIGLIPSTEFNFETVAAHNDRPTGAQVVFHTSSGKRRVATIVRTIVSEEATSVNLGATDISVGVLDREIEDIDFYHVLPPTDPSTGLPIDWEAHIDDALVVATRFNRDVPIPKDVVVRRVDDFAEFDVSSPSGTVPGWTVNGVRLQSLNITTIPEPSSTLLLAAGLLSLFSRRR